MWLDAQRAGMERRIAAVVGQHAVNRAEGQAVRAALGDIGRDNVMEGETVAVLGENFGFRDFDLAGGHPVQHRAEILARQGAGKQAGGFRLGQVAIA